MPLKFNNITHKKRFKSNNVSKRIKIEKLNNHGQKLSIMLPLLFNVWQALGYLFLCVSANIIILNQERMGLCESSEETSKISNSFFHQDIEVEPKTQIFMPSFSQLFNAFRKTSEFVVLHPDNKSNKHIFPNTSAFNVQTAKTNQLKTLLNSKKILLIGNYRQYKQTVIKRIKSQTSCARLYLVNESFCLNFVSQFPIFKSSNWQAYKLTTSQVPILVFDSNDRIEQSASHSRVYIHASNKKDMKLYGLLGIDENCVIKQPTDSLMENVKEYYFQALIKNTRKNVVLLHNQKIDSSTLTEVFIKFIKSKYQIPAPFISIYLGKSLSKASFQSTEGTQKKSKALQTHQVTETSLLQHFRNLFQQLQRENGIQKTERAYNLLNTLITNVCSNQSNDMYRRVKRANKQITQLLSSKAGKALLDEIGFREEGDKWVNSVQSKYLKIFKTDFDLGYKQYKNKQRNL